MLTEKKMTPTELSEELDIPISHVSKALSELNEKEVIKCLTPERRKKKFYEATEKGHSLKKQIKGLIRNEK